MADGKLTVEELTGMFGGSLPMEAYSLVFEGDGTKTIGEVRAELIEMARRAQEGRKSEMVERVAAALRGLPVRDRSVEGGELDNLRLREAARAAIAAMPLSNEDVSGHPTLGMDAQDTFNFILQEALAGKL